MGIKLETDGNGNVLLYPMTGYELRAIADMSLMVVIEYVERPEQLEHGERKQLQALLYADQALEFAEALSCSFAICSRSRGTG